MNAKFQDQSAASGPSLKKKISDSKTVQDSVSPLKVQSGNDSLSLENVKHSDKANHQPRNTTSPKSKAAGSSGALHLKCSKSAHQQSNSVPGKSRPIVLEKSTVARQKENNGMHDQDNATVSRQSNQITVSISSYVKHIRVLILAGLESEGSMNFGSFIFNTPKNDDSLSSDVVK